MEWLEKSHEKRSNRGWIINAIWDYTDKTIWRWSTLLFETVKVRIANTDTRVGKSNGYRMIYYVVKNDYEIYLLTIYYKKEDNKIPSNKEIEALVKEYCL